MEMLFAEAMRLKDRMPKGLFRGVDRQAADEIWLCAIEAAERYHNIPRKEQGMNEDIIRMAREAELYEDGQFFVCKHDELERFAALVAAAEREACAKVCDARYMGDNNREDMEARRCAAAIRARGIKQDQPEPEDNNPSFG